MKQTPKDLRAIRGMHLDLDSTLQSLALLLCSGIGLGTHDTTSPVSSLFLVLVCVSLLDGGDEFGELGLVLSANFSERKNGSSLLVYDCSETCFALDDLW